MKKSPPKPTRHTFISHASADLDAAVQIERTLKAERLDVWLDHSEIQLGVLLAGELQASISDCRVLVLLWSERAAASRWVNSEWLAAHHLNRFILPCVLDDTTLPQCFEHSVHLDLRRAREAPIATLRSSLSSSRRTSRCEGAPISVAWLCWQDADAADGKRYAAQAARSTPAFIPQLKV